MKLRITNIFSLKSLPFIIALAAGLIFVTFQIVGFHLEYFPGDLGDGRLNLYFLEHAHQFFSGQVDSYWNAPFMYPEKNVIAYSDNLLGSAPLYSLLRLLGFKLFTAYQLWYIIITILNYSSAYFFLLRKIKNNYAATVGAFVFAFSIALHSQLTHAQTFPRFCIPLAFFFALNFIETRKVKDFFLTLFFIVFQIYCGIYLGFLLAIPIMVLFFVAWKKTFSPIFSNWKAHKKWLQKILASAAINMLILLPLMLPYTERKQSPTLNHFKKVLDTVPVIKSYIFSKPGSILWDWLSGVGNNLKYYWNQQLFAGGIATLAMLLMAFYFIRKKSLKRPSFSPFRSTKQFVVTIGITFVLYLRVWKITPYILIYVLPGYSSMRSIDRIINIELIFFAFAAAYMVSILFKKFKKYNWALFIILITVLVADNFVSTGHIYRTSKNEAIERMTALEPVFSSIPEGAVVSYEPSENNSPHYKYQIDAMLCSQQHQLKTINAYTATGPHAYNEYWWNLNEAGRKKWLESIAIPEDSIIIIHAIDSVSIAYTK